MRIVSLACLLILAAPAVAFSGVFDIYGRSAGTDVEQIGRDVSELAALAEAHIDNVGLGNAVRDFQKDPWIREANGLHLWGVTITGTHWFDAGHPEFVGLQVNEMSDIEGRHWAKMAIDSATGDGPKRFEILFPHPRSGKAARGFHECFMLSDGQRALCAGAFQDIE
ncbi:MAG: hypothetical protein AAF543_04515 [Pseudomonadota bacterium]